MNFKSNAMLIVPAMVLGLACAGCARKERVEVVESDVDVATVEAEAEIDTTRTLTTDQTVTTESMEDTDTEIAEAEPQYEPAPETLPQTAGPLPALALGGMLSLLAGFGFSLRRRIG